VPQPSPIRILHADEHLQTSYPKVAMTSSTFACLLTLSVHTRESSWTVARSEDVYSGRRGSHSLGGVNKSSIVR
jgi:hypothetical protein